MINLYITVYPKITNKSLSQKIMQIRFHLKIKKNLIIKSIKLSRVFAIPKLEINIKASFIAFSKKKSATRMCAKNIFYVDKLIFFFVASPFSSLLTSSIEFLISSVVILAKCLSHWFFLFIFCAAERTTFNMGMVQGYNNGFLVSGYFSVFKSSMNDS